MSCALCHRDRVVTYLSGQIVALAPVKCPQDGFVASPGSCMGLVSRVVGIVACSRVLIPERGLIGLDDAGRGGAGRKVQTPADGRAVGAPGPCGESVPHSEVMPPSTANREPVAKAPSLLARKTMIPSTSCAVPARPNGMRPTIAERSAGSSEIVVTSGVSV